MLRRIRSSFFRTTPIALAASSAIEQVEQTHSPFLVSQNGGKIVAYAVDNNEWKTFAQSDAAAAISWMGTTAGSRVPTLFEVDEASRMPDQWGATMKQAGCVVANDRLWDMTYAMLTVHGRNITGYERPASLEHAYAMVNQKAFEGAAAEPSQRQLSLAWETLHSVTKLFGQPGMKKQLSPKEQILRRAAKPLRFFSISVETGNSKVTKANATKRIRYTAVVCGVDGEVMRVPIETFAQPKVITLINKLFVPMTTTVLFPTSDTSRSILLNFVRSCAPKCPFVVVDPTAVTKSVTSDLAVPELMNAIMNVPDWRNVASKEARERITRPTSSKAPVQVEDGGKVDEVLKAASSTYLVNGNRRNEPNPVVHRALENWKKTIYESPERKAREEAAALRHSKYIVLDLETTTVKRYRRVANPFTGENHIVLPGMLDFEGKLEIPATYHTREAPYQLPSLDGYDLVVGHNIKFDLLHLWKDPSLQAFFKRGGKIWDTMYAEYLLTGHKVQLGTGAGLEDIAKKRGGKIPKLDEVKAAWASGKKTYDIPHATLKKYLEGDLYNTEMVFKQQLAEAVDQRQAQIIETRMDGLLSTTEMEFNGMKIDTGIAQSQKMDLNNEISRLRQSIIKFVPAAIPPEFKFKFNWQSNQHLGALFFGGDVKIETGAREVKKFPGRGVSRLELASYQPEEGKTNPWMAPPRRVYTGAECALLSGQVDVDRSTRLAKTYYDPVLNELDFRRSAELDEMLSTKVVADGNTAFLGDLYAKRFVPVVTGIAKKADGTLDSMVLSSLIDGKTFSYSGANDAAGLEDFLAKQVEAHTPKSAHFVDNSSINLPPPAVLLICRNAAFEMNQVLESDSDVGKILKDDNDEQAFVVQCCDATAVLEYTHKNHPIVAANHLTSSATLKKTAKGKKTKTPPKEKPTSTLDLYAAEGSLSAKEWCNLYVERLAGISLEVLDEDIELAGGETPKKLTKRQREKLATKITSSESSEDRPAVLGGAAQLKALVAGSEAELKRLAVLRLLGKGVATLYDPFVRACVPESELLVPLPGLLQQYVPDRQEQLEALEKFRSTVTRQPAVNEESLKFIKAKGDAVSATLMELKKLTKLMGTYYEDNGTGMVSLVHPSDSCIHHELIHNKTNTGRLASANPNCQNLPKEDKSDLREVFVSRFNGGVCIECDYSQLEVITLCALANDKQMTADLEAKIDFHCKRVTLMRPDLSYDEVVQRAKIDKEPAYSKLRQQAKIFSFQRQYGAGIRTISESTGLTHDEVRNLIENEKVAYNGINEFTEMVTLSANSFEGSLQDGARNTRGDLVFKGMFPVITGSRYVFTEADLPKSMQKAGNKTTAFSPTHIKNYPVQGFAGEIVQIMLGRLWRHFVENNNYGGKALLTNTVHDCVWVDAEADVASEVCEDVQRIMSSAKDVLNEVWPEMNCIVEFPVDVVIGANMAHLAPVGKK